MTPLETRWQKYLDGTAMGFRLRAWRWFARTR
jgi:hypothetical protein